MKTYKVVLELDEGWLFAVDRMLSYVEDGEVVRWISTEEVQ